MAGGNADHAVDMLTQVNGLLRAMLSGVRDLLPIVAVIAFFQIVVLQQAPSELAGLLGGALCVVTGLTCNSGGVTTSTVTVPLVAALGLGLAETVPGRSPLIDGFGLIAFASLFPMISVMGYAQPSEFQARRVRAVGDAAGG